MEPWPGELVLDAAAANDVSLITRVVDYGGLFHDDVRPGHSFAEYDHRKFRPDGWVEAGDEKLARMRPYAERHGLTLLQLACQWNLAHPAVRCVAPTLIQESGGPDDPARAIEDKRAELAALPGGDPAERGRGRRAARDRRQHGQHGPEGREPRPRGRHAAGPLGDDASSRARHALGDRAGARPRAGDASPRCVGAEQELASASTLARRASAAPIPRRCTRPYFPWKCGARLPRNAEMPSLASARGEHGRERPLLGLDPLVEIAGGGDALDLLQRERRLARRACAPRRARCRAVRGLRRRGWRGPSRTPRRRGSGRRRGSSPAPCSSRPGAAGAGCRRSRG